MAEQRRRSRRQQRRRRWLSCSRRWVLRQWISVSSLTSHLVIMFLSFPEYNVSVFRSGSRIQGLGAASVGDVMVMVVIQFSGSGFGSGSDSGGHGSTRFGFGSTFIDRRLGLGSDLSSSTRVNRGVSLGRSSGQIRSKSRKSTIQFGSRVTNQIRKWCGRLGKTGSTQLTRSTQRVNSGQQMVNVGQQQSTKDPVKLLA
ncbi:hypothetical protein Hanom_Chr10g00889431 [Helianthus anomalus]